MAEEHVSYRNPAAIPDFAELSKSFRAWIPDILEIRKIEEELSGLAKVEKEIRGLRPTREEFRGGIRASAEGYRQRHISRVAKFLSENLTARDPLSRLERLNHLVPGFIPVEDFIEAEALLPDEIFGTAPDKKRAAELAKIAKHRQELETRMAELTPPPYLRLDRLGTLRDVRMNFIHEWESKQRTTREPCDVCGLALKHCDEDTKWAYRELGIAAFVNERTGLLAAVP